MEFSRTKQLHPMKSTRRNNSSRHALRRGALFRLEVTLTSSEITTANGQAVSFSSSTVAHWDMSVSFGFEA